ncbi:hypothetical protein CEXT_41591 [Caerostris extrusa]|uniref:Uncharacterized protein n=1 Tax=Caerostris extrusa TaxID=172846 RepID=A0AAV4RLS7_CAEEX|nr:hypothetical protein CEXT_41591 [Caerostris extrusa]
MVNEISSLVDSAEYTTLPDSFATPPLLNSSATDGAQKGVFKKKLQPKILMNRYSRSISSTPRNGRIQEKGKRLLKFSKSDTTHDQRRGESNKENQMFDFYSQLGKEDPTPQPEADISVFLSTPDSSSENE